MKRCSRSFSVVNVYDNVAKGVIMVRVASHSENVGIGAMIFKVLYSSSDA